MSKDQVWKEEGLTIASLALRANIPETQLRRLINDCLGYRNFPSYVNAHRITAAKNRLADPTEAREIGGDHFRSRVTSRPQPYISSPEAA